jgi:hypothetical protein
MVFEPNLVFPFLGFSVESHSEAVSMRVCPKCGHHDPFYWRGSAVVIGLEFCKLDQLQEDEPNLAKTLLEARKEFGAKNFVFDKDYCYHLTKANTVERQSLIENPDPKGRWHIPVEQPQTANPSYFGYLPHHHGKKIQKFNPLKNQTKLDSTVVDKEAKK